MKGLRSVEASASAAALALALALAAGTAHADGAFSAADQALWIDRFNYFRMTGLPWSAGDMRRMGWDASLATSAASTASACSATTAAGVNAFSVSAATANSSSLSLVDQAVTEWIVDTSLSTLATMDAPAASGDGVGTGVYNAYSQAVWAATYSVGCASASCSDETMVVCEFSPAGNDGSSAWYTHADQGSLCPSGTVSSTGLCIVEGDAANDAIAAIPAGQEAYQVFPTYVSDLQTVLLEHARAVASGTASESAASASSAETAAATTSAPSTTTKAPSATTKTPSATSSPSSSSSTSTSATSASASDTAASSTGTTATFEDDSGSTSPGTVQASSASGSTFGNEVTSSESEGESPTSASAASTTTTAESTTTAPATSGSSSTSSVSANNESGTSSSGVSATGMAGVIVVAVAAVAGVAVFVSYRKNQQRQRDIMQNGGIHVL